MIMVTVTQIGIYMKDPTACKCIHWLAQTYAFWVLQYWDLAYVHQSPDSDVFKRTRGNEFLKQKLFLFVNQKTEQIKLEICVIS